ncbi:hypothetical protein D3C71_1223990 [compost metagenome]
MRGREGQRHVGELVLGVERTEGLVLVGREVFAHPVARRVDIGAAHAVEATRARVGGLHHGRGRQHVLVGEVEHRRRPGTGLDAPDTTRLEAEARHRILELLPCRLTVLVRTEHAVADIPCLGATVVDGIDSAVDLLVAGIGRCNQRVFVDLVGGREVAGLRAKEVGQAQRRIARVGGLACARVVDLLAAQPGRDLGKAALETLEQHVERHHGIGAAAQLVLLRPEIGTRKGLVDIPAKERIGCVHAARRRVELHVHCRAFRRPAREQRWHLELGAVGPTELIGPPHRCAVDEDLVDRLAFVRCEDHHDVLELSHRPAVEHRNDGSADTSGRAVDRGPRRFRTDQRGRTVTQVGHVFRELAGSGLSRLLLGLRGRVGVADHGNRGADDQAANRGRRPCAGANSRTDCRKEAHRIRHCSGTDAQKGAKDQEKTNQTRHAATPAVKGKNWRRSLPGATMFEPVQMPKLWPDTRPTRAPLRASTTSPR